MPCAVELAPIAGRVPAFRLDRRPAVGEPQGRRRVAAVGHEFEPLRIGDETAGDARRLQQDLVRRPLVVEAVSRRPEADRVDAGRQLGKSVGAGCARRRLPVRRRSRRDRILREGMQDVGEDQLLVLLLVMQPDLEDAQHLRRARVSSAVAISRSTAASTCARKAATSCAVRPREQPALRPRMARARPRRNRN